MSRGLGVLQRRLLAMIEASDGVCSTRNLACRIISEDHGADRVAALAHLRSTDAAVRRALRTMERRGLVADIGLRMKGERKSLKVYATAAAARDLLDMAAELDRVAAEREAAGKPSIREAAAGLVRRD